MAQEGDVNNVGRLSGQIGANGNGGYNQFENVGRQQHHSGLNTIDLLQNKQGINSVGNANNANDHAMNELHGMEQP